MVKNTKEMTNSNFVEHALLFAPTSTLGAVAQLLALEAIRKQAEEIIEMDFEDLKKAFGPTLFIAPDIWLAAANSLKEDIEHHIREGHVPW
jgi:hypothetical protein